ERLTCDLLDEVVIDARSLYGGVDVAQHELVDCLLVEDANGVDRVADVLLTAELDRLHEVTIAHQEHRDHPGVDAHRLRQNRRAQARDVDTAASVTQLADRGPAGR